MPGEYSIPHSEKNKIVYEPLEKVEFPIPEQKNTSERLRELSKLKQDVVTEIGSIPKNIDFLKKVIQSLNNKRYNRTDIIGLTKLEGKLVKLFSKLGQVDTTFIEQQVDKLSADLQKFNTANKLLTDVRDLPNTFIKDHFSKASGIISVLKYLEKKQIEYGKNKETLISRDYYINNKLDAYDKIDLIVIDEVNNYSNNSSLNVTLTQVKTQKLDSSEINGILRKHANFVNEICTNLEITPNLEIKENSQIEESKDAVQEAMSELAISLLLEKKSSGNELFEKIYTFCNEKKLFIKVKDMPEEKNIQSRMVVLNDVIKGMEALNMNSEYTSVIKNVYDEIRNDFLNKFVPIDKITSVFYSPAMAGEKSFDIYKKDSKAPKLIKVS